MILSSFGKCYSSLDNFCDVQVLTVLIWRSINASWKVARLGYFTRLKMHFSSIFYHWNISKAHICLSHSLHLYSEAHLTSTEKLELAHRRINLLYYLMRSPVFHTVTHKRIQYLLATLSRRVPLARMVCVPLMEYIPQWQKIYAYTWS